MISRSGRRAGGGARCNCNDCSPPSKIETGRGATMPSSLPRSRSQCPRNQRRSSSLGTVRGQAPTEIQTLSGLPIERRPRETSNRQIIAISIRGGDKNQIAAGQYKN
jgi:hypothetical protein